MEKVRHYFVRRDILLSAHIVKHHSRFFVDRPTPWSVFFRSFWFRCEYGFVIMRDDQVDRLLSDRYAAVFVNGRLKNNGDVIQVQKWSLLNVCKFCLEGFQYSTFWQFWAWTWKG